MMNTKYLSYLKRRLARSCIGPSTARGMGPKGTISSARSFLEHFDPRILRSTSEQGFLAKLNEATEEMMEQMPDGARHWGSCRKFLNIFVRGCVYDRFLCDQFDLKCVEPWLEVPLDSHVAKGLHGEELPKDLPRWKTVIGLQKHESQRFQDFAKKVAENEGVFRVHLDLKYWRGDHILGISPDLSPSTLPEDES